jgi:hypothetical protein
VHRTTGRIRIQVPQRRHDRAYFAALAARLAQLPAVDAVEVNPLTASTLVRHAADFDTSTIADEMAALDATACKAGAATADVVAFPVRTATPRPPASAPARELPTASFAQDELVEVLVDLGVLAVTRRPPARLVERGLKWLCRLAFQQAARRSVAPI